MTRLLSLCLPVKNEAASIRTVLESVMPHVDAVTILLDEESEDETEKIASETLSGAGITHQIVRRKFLGYAGTRNLALELDAEAHRSAFQLCWSGDEFLRDGEALRQFLAQRAEDEVYGKLEAFRIRLVLDGDSNFTPRIVRTGSAWKFQDDDCGVHEYLANSDAMATCGSVPKAWIEHVASHPENRLENIEQVHIPLLRAALDRNPDNARALIFLAQSYEALLPVYAPWERLMYMMEAMALYKRRLVLAGGSEHERSYCKMRYLTDALLTGVYSPAEERARAEELYQEDPKRPECALLRVRTAIRAGVTVLEAYELAVDATRVCAEAASIENHSPRRGDVAWQSHLIAAKAAVRISLKSSDAVDKDGRSFADLTSYHIEQGLELGGPIEHFAPIVEALSGGSAQESPPPPPQG